jgi:hypothetical protein
MRPEAALQLLRRPLEQEIARLATALGHAGEARRAAALRCAACAARHEAWQQASRRGLRAAALDPGRLLDLEQRRRTARMALDAARRELQALERREAESRDALARLRHRERALEDAARRLAAAERARCGEAAARAAEDAWLARTMRTCP